MKIEINLKIILMFVLCVLFYSMNTYIIFLIFIIIHEVAHLISGLIIGGKPKKFSLNPFGVSLDFYYYGKNSFLCETLFCMSGPFINFLIYIILENWNIEFVYKEEIMYTNLAVCLFNLIPILPLDGGKILKIILKKCVGFEKSNLYTIVFSKIFLIIISFLYSVFILKVKNIILVFLLIYLWYLYLMEEKKYILYKKTKETMLHIGTFLLCKKD